MNRHYLLQQSDMTLAFKTDDGSGIFNIDVLHHAAVQIAQKSWKERKKKKKMVGMKSGRTQGWSTEGY